ncbi:c-type cytochrome [Methyloraptor flagellatus]|jgi:cytochrome c|uniref:Cytochrome c family protein n=1 Tax=Methyloraptor flagellatus TaxID=3162530 RepID=A0AAU7XAK8_9HYPH
MDSFELNKIAGAVLGACLFAMGLGIITDIIFDQPAPEKPGFMVAVAETKAGGDAGAKAAEVAPIAARLKTATADAGQKVFAKCASCHTPEKGAGNKVGPNLYGVVDRVKGSEAGFGYSGALADLGKQGQKWTYDDLDHFLANPGAVVKGTKMSFKGLDNPDDRAAVIMFLHSKADAPAPLPN